MSQATSNTTRKLSLRRPTERQGKRAVGISVLAFFAAIAVVGWFGLSGLQVEDDEPKRTRQLIFAGGAPRLAVVEESPTADEEAAASAEQDEGDDYVVGSFGEPMDEFYANEGTGAGGGGWGDAAMDRMSDFVSSSPGSDERGRRD